MEAIYTASFEPIYDVGEIDDIRKNDIIKNTAKVEAMYKEHNIVSKSVILDGHPAEEIINYAEKINADLIVCGTRGHGGFSVPYL